MVALRRTLAVNCRRCGRSAERIRRADDLRTPDQIVTSGRCGFCRARACDGEVDIVPVDTPINKHPGLILEDDGELHPRSLRNGGGVRAAPELVIVGSGRKAGQSAGGHPSKTCSAPRRIDLAQRVFQAGAILAGVSGLFVVGLLIASAVFFVGRAVHHALDQATASPARELTYNFADPLEREAYCRGRAYLINVRGADVSEDVREMRRNVMRHCPDLAAVR